MHEIVLPRIDAAMQSGRIIEWLKKEGEKVVNGEPVVRVEGEKTTFEVEAPASGVLRSIFLKPGSEAPVGDVLAVIGEPEEEVPAHYTRAPSTLTSPPVQIAAQVAPQKEGPLPREVRASPAARALARKRGIDLAQVKGTGVDGRIQAEDVLKALGRQESPILERLGTTPRVTEIIPLHGIRKTVAERLSYSFHTTVPVLLTTEVDLETLQEGRKRIGSNVSVTAFIVKAAARALREHLILNSSLDENKIYDDINVAVAIHTPEGLTAPTIVGPENTNLVAISEKIAGLRERAASGRLTIDEVTGDTFTVTNLGAEGIDIFAPIINPPQAAILAVGQLTRKPVVVGDSVTARSRATLSLIYDHRITDGVPAAQFLAHVKRLLENPDSLAQ